MVIAYITENFYDMAVLLTQLLTSSKLFWGSILYKIALYVYISVNFPLLFEGFGLKNKQMESDAMKPKILSLNDNAKSGPAYEPVTLATRVRIPAKALLFEPESNY